jgi:hypothetical protein
MNVASDEPASSAPISPAENNEYAPSELLAPLLEEWPDLLDLVLAYLDPTDCTLLARVAKPWLAVVLANNLPRAGMRGTVPLDLADFDASVNMLAWAKDNDCLWHTATCALIASGGRLEVLQWAREHDCPWDEWTCARAAGGGHLAVLKWAREHDCQ